MAEDKFLDDNRIRLATETAMFLAGRLRHAGIDVHVVGQEEARRVYEERDGSEEYSVADMQRANYYWGGEEVSLRTFAQAFSSFIKQKDRTA